MSGASGVSTPLGGKKPFVRQRAAQTVADDMGALGAFSYLKAEATAIQRAGIKGLLQDDCAALAPLLNPYLSGTAAKVHSDELGADHEEHNGKTYGKLPAEYQKKLDNNTGTVPLQFDKEHALNVYCKVIENLKTGNTADDGVPEFYIDSAGGKEIKKKSGGFQKLYDPINVPPALIKKTEQDRCIFAMKPSEFAKAGGSYAKTMMNASIEHVRGLYPAETHISLKVVHVLFHWNAHSFFTYHTDEDGVATVIINLAHCKASMHVAGAQSADYDGIGSARLFPSNVFHRSGTAPRRCIKVALFYDVGAEVTVLDEGEEGEPAQKDENVKKERDEEDEDAQPAKKEAKKDDVTQHVQQEAAASSGSAGVKAELDGGAENKPSGRPQRAKR